MAFLDTKRAITYVKIEGIFSHKLPSTYVKMKGFLAHKVCDYLRQNESFFLTEIPRLLTSKRKAFLDTKRAITYVKAKGFLAQKLRHY